MCCKEADCSEAELLEDADLRGQKLGFAKLANSKFGFGRRKPWTAKLGARVADWFERVVVRFSIYGNPPVYDEKDFSWVADIERNWKKIRAELDAVMVRRDELPGFHEITDKVKVITEDDRWKTYFLAAYGREIEANSRRCPETARVLRSIPGMQTAFFSILSPGKRIPVHRGPYNGVLRYHIGLVVPEPRQRCRIRIGNEIKTWEEGESFIFDDTYLHEVWNETDGCRAILFVDFERPLKFPMSVLNRLLFKVVNYTSIVRKARENQKKWEKSFYKK